MPSPIREQEAGNIVLVGSFNPAIFQPYWLAQHGLVADGEAEAASVEVIHADITVISVGPFRVKVERERAVFEIDDFGKQGPLKDFVVGLLQLLPHSPVGALGFNRHMHFRVPSKENLDRIGFAISPREPWTDFLENPELRGLVKWGRRSESKGRIQIQVEPSAKFVPGLYVAVNEQHALPDLRPIPIADVLQTIESHFDSALAYALVVADDLLRLSEDKL